MLKIFYSIILILSSLTPLYANDGFILENLEEAKKISQITNKPVLVIFGADYCKFCDQLKKDILDFQLSPAIDKYIVCYLDVGKDKNLKKTYNIGIIPDSRIIMKDKEKSSNKGYTKNIYINWINSVK